MAKKTYLACQRKSGKNKGSAQKGWRVVGGKCVKAKAKKARRARNKKRKGKRIAKAKAKKVCQKASGALKPGWRWGKRGRCISAKGATSKRRR